MRHVGVVFFTHILGYRVKVVNKCACTLKSRDSGVVKFFDLRIPAFGRTVIFIVKDSCRCGKDNNSAPTSTYAQQYQNQQNGMAQVQQMAGQTVQTRQAQQIQPHNDGFQEDIPWDSQDIPF